MKAITENQLHDFLINSRHSCKKYCLHNSTLWGITITVDPWIKFGLRKGDRFIKKLSFFRVFLRWSWTFFSPIGLVSFIDPLHQKLAKAWCWKLPKYENWHFSRSYPLKVWPPLSPKFSRWPQFFFKILTTVTKGSITPKSEGVPDVRD